MATSATISMNTIKTGSWRSLALKFLHILPMSYRWGFLVVFSCGFGYVVCKPATQEHGIFSPLTVCAVLLSWTEGVAWSFHIKFLPVSLDTMLRVWLCVRVSEKCAIFYPSSCQILSFIQWIGLHCNVCSGVGVFLGQDIHRHVKLACLIISGNPVSSYWWQVFFRYPNKRNGVGDVMTYMYQNDFCFPWKFY